MKTMLKTTLTIAALAAAAHASAQVTMYEHEDFSGKSFTAQRTVEDLNRFNFSDRASSVVVRNQRFEVCDDEGFHGRCVVLKPGRYPSLGEMGLNDRVTSIRPVSASARAEDDYAPPADYRRRSGERTFEANVTNVRAVMGTPEQRCWVEREEVNDNRGRQVGSAIAGAVLGGILGHQVGGGTGRDVATVGGAVAGGAIGNRVGRGDTQSRDVQRCENVANSAKTDYWDVTYTFRGEEHHVQMTQPPGRTLMVNGRGEPRT